MDNYTEQIISARPSFKQHIFVAFAIAFTCIGIFIAVFSNFSNGFSIGAVMVIVGGIAIYFLKYNMVFEYEYIFTNADFDIAKIVAKSTRKEMFSVSDGDIRRVLPYNSNKFQNELDINSNLTVYDFTSGDEDNSYRWFAFIINRNKKDYALILEMTEKNIDYLKSVYKKKMEE